jgi:polar amino acid transport system substrate-binding protein
MIPSNIWNDLSMKKRKVLLPVVQNVESGKTDYNLIDAAMVKMYEDEFGLKLKTIPLIAEEQKLISENTYSYFLISKGAEGEQLAKDVNKALKEVIEDGTVSEISQKYFKGDFAPKVQ